MANGYRIEYFVYIAPLVWWPAIFMAKSLTLIVFADTLYTIQGVCKDYNIIKVSLII